MKMQATMDFFQYQDAARRRTTTLVGLYCLAVVLIILAVYAPFVLIYHLVVQGTPYLSFGALWPSEVRFPRNYEL